MKVTGAYYNEIDPFCAQWLRNLIAKDLIAAGDVDERSVVEVHPDDLKGYSQCHFFAGIGGWSYALRLAGWPDDRPVWTGSCPCQPFSRAGRLGGSDDERHLWPAWFRLIRECAPGTIFGEQVAGSAGLAWLDHVCADLESSGYAVAAADLPAACVGAPHIRQRLWFVAHPHKERCVVNTQCDGAAKQQQAKAPYGDHSDGCGINGVACAVANSECRSAERWGHDVAGTPRGVEGEAWKRERFRDEPEPSREHHILGDADSTRLEIDGEQSAREECAPAERAGWSDLEWLECTDGKARPTQSGLRPLAHGVPGRVGRLRAYGNAIVPQVAAEFIRAVMECKMSDKFSQWAIVELMGHQQCAGRVTEEVIGGAALIRVDIPDGTRADGLESFRTSYFGASAIYAIHVVDESAARASAAALGKTPPYAWRLEAGMKRLAAPDMFEDPQ